LIKAIVGFGRLSLFHWPAIKKPGDASLGYIFRNQKTNLFNQNV
jgi:hypothetical protein